MNASLQAGDTKAISHVAHTVKGVSGAIRANELNRAAAELETAAKGGSADTIAIHLQRFGQALAPVLQGIALLTLPLGEAANSPVANPDKVDWAAVHEGLDALEGSLKAGLSRAEAQIREISDLLGAAGIDDLLHGMQGQIDEFEFDAALATLAEVRRALSAIAENDGETK